MKGHRFRAWVLLMVMAIGPIGPVRAGAGQERDEDGSENAMAEEPQTDAFIPGTKGQFQAGVYYRFAGDRFHEGGENYLFSLDLNVLFNWDRRVSTWGLGLHVALDGDGNNRIGPKVLWRTSLEPDSPRFFQAGAGLYLGSSDYQIRANNSQGESMIGTLAMPGLFLEAEMGFNDWFSLTLAMEALKVEYAMSEDYYNSYTNSGSLEETIDTHFYVGGKLGGWKAGVLLLAGVAVAGVVVASTVGTWGG